MKKAKKSAKNNMIPNQSAVENIPTQDPHLDNAKKDANFKKQRGAQR